MTTLSENWATLWESLADAQPDHTAVIVGSQQLTWEQFDDRAARLATGLAAHGLTPHCRVAQLLYNCPEYLETIYAAFKMRATPVNVSYRYLSDEVAHVLRDSGARAIVFHGSLGERLIGLRDLLPDPVVLVQVDDGAPLLDGAVWYDDLVSSAPAPRVERSGDDLLFMYTGGTTGRPKGVVWRHADLFGVLAFTAYVSVGLEVPTAVDEVGRIAASLNEAGRSPVNLCAPPLMHASALFLGISAFVLGGTVVLLGGRRFDPDELWRLVADHHVTLLAIVGDAFARPMVETLDAAAGSYGDLSSVRQILSTGATLSVGNKRSFQRHLPAVAIIDSLGASEGGPFGMSITLPGSEPTDTAVFTALPDVVVIDDSTGRPATRGSGVVGMLAATGSMPLGYHGDPDKTAATFREIDGVRFTVPGDYATIDADGRVQLLGRGSVCINTGGEKVYPEEVEVASRSHDGVLDCVVVGMPDDRFGEAVTLVASRVPGSEADEAEVIDHVRRLLAAYKAPRRVVWVDAVYRSPSGKADYGWARDQASASARQ